MVADLDPRDRVQPAASRLVADYARYLDERDADAFVGLFIADGEIIFGERRIIGHEALRKFLDGTPRGLHVPGTPSISLEADHVLSYSTVVFVDSSSSGIRAVANRDRMVWSGDRLLFERRELELRADTLRPRT
jgi:hypothetical protein